MGQAPRSRGTTSWEDLKRELKVGLVNARLIGVTTPGEDLKRELKVDVLENTPVTILNDRGSQKRIEGQPRGGIQSYASSGREDLKRELKARKTLSSDQCPRARVWRISKRELKVALAQELPLRTSPTQRISKENWRPSLRTYTFQFFFTPYLRISKENWRIIPH